MVNRKRVEPIYIYVSKEERLLLEEKIKLAGTATISAFIRQLIRYGFVYQVDYTPLREMNAQLGKIGSNVNQIAKRVNETSRIYIEDICEIKELMEKIWQLQRSILSRQPSIKR